MVKLSSGDLKEGFKAPEFELLGVDGRNHKLSDLAGKKGTVVAFVCNHCPYVLGAIDDLVYTSEKLEQLEIAMVAIMPNDVTKYPQDSYENMVEFARNYGFNFPYLWDSTQGVARAYGALCTPDIFGFDKDLLLRYRGCIASSEAGEDKYQLFEAMREMVELGDVKRKQYPSQGCSIKWK